jgi:hypothetical protein
MVYSIVKGNTMPAKTPELIGQTFSDLYVKEKIAKPNHLKPHKCDTYYLCECHCSSPNCFKTLIVRKDHLVSGNTKSCKSNKNSLKTIEEAQKSSFKNVFSRKRYTDGNITLDQFTILASLNCFYCTIVPFQKNNDFERMRKQMQRRDTFSAQHGDIHYNGLDRIDSNLPHNLSNVVPCCPNCNSFKLERSYETTINHIPLLNPDFVYKNIDDFSFVRDQIKKAKAGQIPWKNTKGKQPLSKLFPEKYGRANRSYIYHRTDVFMRNAKKEDRFCELTIEEIAELMMANCIYCNTPPNLITGKFNGLDRYINNDATGKRIDYTRENSVPSCHYCNSAKKELKIEDFRAWIIRLRANYQNLPKTFEELISQIAHRNQQLFP